MTEYELEFDFENLHRAFSARIGQILERAGFLLAAADAREAHDGLMKADQAGALDLKLVPRPLDDVKKEVRPWIIGCALRECIEQVSFFLEVVRETCAAVAAVIPGPVRVEKFHKEAIEPGKKFHKLPFPEKIDRLRTQFGSAILDHWIDHVLTLNKARNCLVHRFGVVSESDCTGGLLTISWVNFEVVLRTPDGLEKPVEPNIFCPVGGQIILRQNPIERQYKPGERVSITAADLTSIWLTLDHFGQRTAQRVSEYATAKHGAADRAPPEPESADAG